MIEMKDTATFLFWKILLFPSCDFFMLLVHQYLYWVPCH